MTTPIRKMRPKMKVMIRPREKVLRSLYSMPVSARFMEKLLANSTDVTIRPIT